MPEPTTAELLAELEERRQAALQAGSDRAVAKQHARGKMTARERIDFLLDPGTFEEYDDMAQSRVPGAKAPLGDGVITGLGRIDGRLVAIFSQDYTVLGGSLGEAFGKKVIKIMDQAAQLGIPLIGLNDSAGARIQESVDALAYYAEIGHRVQKLSGVIPQIAVIMGSCAGGAVYVPMGSDVVVMVDKTSHMFITGPDVVAAVTGEEVTLEELGGAYTNAAVAGNVHHLASDDKDALDYVRNVLSYLPDNNMSDPPRYHHQNSAEVTAADRELDTIIPDNRQMAYDMEDLFRHVLDDREFHEIMPLFGRSILIGFGRVDGRSVGVVANDPRVNAGTLDIDASEKAARFIRFCNAFNIPLLYFVDVPGYLPGVDQERMGIIRRGSKLAFASSQATVPKITTVVRKAYGGGYAVMGSKHIETDLNLAWPTAEIAVMGGMGAVSVLFRDELKQAEAEGRLEEVRSCLITEYNKTMASPYIAAARGYVDAVVPPRETRTRIARALRNLENKRVSVHPRRNSNIPM